MQEVNFKDRVPLYPGRILLTPVAGLENTYTLSRADDPTEEGTPLDKATFNSIIHSRLTGRYYPLTVAQTVATSRAVNVSPIPTSGWTPNSAGTTATSGGYTIAASSAISAVYGVDKAFDNDIETMWGSTDGTSHTFTISLPTSMQVKKIKMALGLTNSSYSFQTVIQGSTNGSTWVDLYTTSEIPDELTEYTLSKTGDYQYYRLKFTRGGSARCYIKELQFSESAINTYKNAFTTEDIPAAWSAGQRITVQTPSFGVHAVASNTFAGITCNTILQPNKRYELRYNGSSFDAKEV